MIYEKELTAPVYRRRSVRREIALFGEKNGALSAESLHFKETERGIVCAEGARSLGAAKTLLLTAGHAEEVFEVSGDALVSPAGERYPCSRTPDALFCFVTGAGEKEYYALYADGCFRLTAEGEQQVGEGGVCGAVHGGRLLIADGSRLRWSAALEPSDPTQAAQKAGWADLPSRDGDILAAISLRDVLYLFRRRGIARLDVRGSTLDFAAYHLPAPSGIVPGSIRKCGDGVRFLAEDGLYAFDGTRCVRLAAGGFSRLDLSKTQTAVCADRYYATAEYNGEKCMWCVEGERGHLLRIRAETLVGGDMLRFTAEGELFELSERGLPPMRRKECVLRTEPSLLGLSSRQKYLDGILIEGRGHFRVEARGEHGLPRAVFGKAGERLPFPLPVRGSRFTLDIRTVDEEARLKALVFDLREEVAKW